MAKFNTGINQKVTLVFEAPEPTSALVVSGEDLGLEEFVISFEQTLEEAQGGGASPYLTQRGTKRLSVGSLTFYCNAAVNERVGRAGRKRCKLTALPDGEASGQRKIEANFLVSRSYTHPSDNNSTVTLDFVLDSDPTNAIGVV